jgi:hypothetical protein
MFTTVSYFQLEAANDPRISRTRTVPIPSSVTAVPNYPNKLVVYKIAASKYWQVRCWHAGRAHKQSTKTCNLVLAQRFARWFYEDLLIKYSTNSSLIKETTPDKPNTPNHLSFGAVAAQVYANEQARVERGEYGYGSLQVFRNRLNAHILPTFGTQSVRDVTYLQLLQFAQALSVKHSPATVSHYLVIARKILVHAQRTSLIEHVPDIPKIKVRSTSRGAFTPTEYWRLLRAARALRGQVHPHTRKELRTKLPMCHNENRMPPDVAWAIGFMVNAFIRPGDLVKLKHRHVEVVNTKQTYLRLTLPETKLHAAPIVTLRPAVRIYKQICKYQKPRKLVSGDDYLFFPEIANRKFAMDLFSYMFNWVLQHTGLKLNPHGHPRSLYSLRHSSITFRLLYGQGIDLVTLARNARTSVEVINNHYASTVTGEQNIAMLQSKRT